MEKVINNSDLLRKIITFIPLTEHEKKRRRKVVSELKHMYCEWSEHKKYCFICKPYHPLVINKHKKYLCLKCKRIIRYYNGLGFYR